MPLLDRTPGQSTMPQAVLGSARRQTSTGIDNVFLLALVFFLVSIVTDDNTSTHRGCECGLAVRIVYYIGSSCTDSDEAYPTVPSVPELRRESIRCQRRKISVLLSARV